MKKQVILISAAFAAIFLLFYFGRTTEKKSIVQSKQPAVVLKESFSIIDYRETLKKELKSPHLSYLSELEIKSNNPDSIIKKNAYVGLGEFWKDSLQDPYLYGYYLSEAAKLDNSEKNLTFAAQFFLENLRGEQDEAKVAWMAAESIDLFERALKFDPENDDLKIGLGSVYIFGKGRGGNSEETMKGVQQLLSVVRKDSNNMKAQLALGIGGFVSGQYDKAIARFLKVIEKQPRNLEAIAFLADSYAASGNKEEAINWYNISKRLANNPHYSKEVDERIKSLK